MESQFSGNKWEYRGMVPGGGPATCWVPGSGSMGRSYLVWAEPRKLRLRFRMEKEQCLRARKPDFLAVGWNWWNSMQSDIPFLWPRHRFTNSHQSTWRLCASLFRLPQFYFPEACLESYPLSGCSPAFESSLWIILLHFSKAFITASITMVKSWAGINFDPFSSRK